MNLTRQQVLNEAINMGDRLLANAEPYNNGLVWKTVHLDATRNAAIIREARDQMYSGCAGIALFLSELYRHTGDKRYKKAAVDGMIGSLALINSSTTYSLFTGRMSVALSLIRIDRLDPSLGFKDRAVEIALESANNTDWNTLDLINGICGTMVGLLHIHAVSNDHRLLRVIDLYVQKILQLISSGKQGIRLERSPMCITSLCGYSHGASGLAYAFIELSKYFNSAAYFEIARQACLYESQFLNEKTGNWKDVRGPNSFEYGDMLQTKYDEGDLKFFLRDREMSAWCHGAPGIGLARLRMNEYAPGNPFAHELQTAIDTTYRLTVTIPNAEDDSPCLCHGLAGNAELFLETYRVTGDKSCLAKAWDVAEKIFLHREKFGRYKSGNIDGVEDDSLFMGNAGVGYFFLRLLDPHRTPSVLQLSLDKTYARPSEQVSSSDISKSLVRCQFPKTFEFVSVNFADDTRSYFDSDIGDDFINSWQSFVRKLLLTQPDNQMLEGIFNLESKILETTLSIVSDQLLYLKDERKQKDIDGLLSGLNDSSVLMTDADLSCLRIGDRIHLLIPTCQSIEQAIISEFGLIVLEAFEKPTTIDEAVDKALTQIDATREEVKGVVISQAQQFIKAGLLLDPAHHKFNIRSRSLNESYVSHE